MSKYIIGLETFNATDKGRRKLSQYFRKVMKKYPGLVVQKAVKGFGDTKECPEMRMYFVGDKYKYSVSSNERWSVMLVLPFLLPWSSVKCNEVWLDPLGLGSPPSTPPDIPHHPLAYTTPTSHPHPPHPPHTTRHTTAYPT